MTEEGFPTSKELILVIIKIILMTGIIFIVVINVIQDSLKKNTDVSEIEDYTLKNILFYNEDCIIFTENTRAIPGMIDLKKFQEYNLNKCFKSSIFGMKLSLIYNNETKTVLINEDIFRQKNFCYDKSQLYCNDKDYYVLINDDNKIKNGILRIELVKLRRAGK